MNQLKSVTKKSIIKDDELKVFISLTESTCCECKQKLGIKAWIFLNKENEVLCLSCADLDHLDFLPSGDMALTIRSKKYSKIYAVVLKWNRKRKRYDRQGLLVQNEAIEKAEQECLKDADIRENRRIRDIEKREVVDENFKKTFAAKIRQLYPQCPEGREILISEHACKKYSGRVGRCAAAKDLEDSAITLAISAHIRHTLTDYDELLSKGHDRSSSRTIISSKVQNILLRWKDRL